MKKYQQLLLLILSVISLVSLLFYRHEYNKLRYVLEVLNFFGTPGVSPSNNSCSNQFSTSSEYNVKLLEPLPSWQRVSNSLFVYSAYWERIEDRNQVKAIALGSLNENLNYGCYLWFEEFEDPVKGQFSFSAVAKSRKGGNRNSKVRSSKTKVYMFYCDPGEDYSTPFGVTFHKTNDENSKAFIPVLNEHGNNPVSNTTAICILPVDAPEIPKSLILEFLAYHQVIGTSHFIIYGGEFFHPILNPLLKDSIFNVELTVLQWNYPFSGDLDIMKSIAEIDCLIRTKGLFESVIVLNWNQYIVPRFHLNLNSMVTDLDPSKKLAKFQLSTLLFCLEYKDDPKSEISLPLSLRKTRYSVLKTEHPVFIYHPHLKISINPATPKVSKDIVAVQWYTKCGEFDLKIPEKNKNYKYDYSIIKYHSDFLKSKILKVQTFS